MKNVNENPVCSHAEDMLALLYGEAQGAEKDDLTRHLDSCLLCRQEFTAFQSVRADLGVWREEIIRTAPARVVMPATLAALPETRQPSWRAAWAALREFFTLSPLWLRGATALAGMAFIALSGLALVKATRTDTPVKSAVQPSVAASAGLSEAEVQSRIVVAVQAERDALHTRQEQQVKDLTAQNEDARQRLAALQAQLSEAQVRDVSAPRVVNAKAVVARPRRKNSSLVAKNTPRRPATPGAATDEEEVSLAEILLGGGK